MATVTEEKYEKLAAEYAKLKSQVTVLKKAYLDEHTECTETKDQVKERDQWLRKCEQEVDSLLFRNQQLSRRVELLQDDLVTAEAQRRKHKKHKGGEGPRLVRNSSVYDEELHGKMEENTHLQTQLQEVSMAYEHQIIALEERMKTCEQDRSRQADIVAALRQSSNSHIEHLQKEKATVEGKVQSQESDIQEYRSRAEVAEQNLESVQHNLQAGLKRAAKIIADKLPFIDTKHRTLNTLNLPTFDRRHQARARDLIGQAATIVGEMTQSLSKFFIYSEQRSRVYPADGQSAPRSAVNVKYCKYLHDSLSYLRPVEQSLKLFSEELQDESVTVLETASELQQLAKDFSRLVAFCNKLLPYQVLSLEEENGVASCPSILAGKNRDLVASLRRFNTILGKVASYLTLLSVQSRPTASHPVSSHGRMFRLLSRMMDQLHDSTREISKVYNAKVSLEHQLPAATPKLKMLDECVVSSLVSMVTSAGKMSVFMTENLEFFMASSDVGGAPVSSSSDGALSAREGPRFHPQVTHFHCRAATFLAALNSWARPDSVPHQTAVENRRVMANSVESREGLGRQMALLQGRAGRVEQDKEHLVLELQLLKVKYDAYRQKAKMLEQELAALHSSGGVTGGTVGVGDIGDVSKELGPPPLPSSSPSTDRRRQSTWSSGPVEPVIVGRVEVEGRGGEGGGDVERREEERLKEHFTQRLNTMTHLIQQADSRAVASHAEVRALHKQLRQVERGRSHAEEELKSTTQTILQLQDELHTTAQSYEQQLSMLSDHLSGMNDRLAQQKDEIDDLRAQQDQKKGAFSKMSRKFRR
ncbi:protein phosphatase 1 regulatory subunit 21-like [Babylonia areolata]|uniref:protein phosphatase 1 regulatory subunit 21-like n=1 Tax=Babylonia areolata TaxID=304850 RepID=UPI003FCF5968